ncbi:MAG: carboxymuconolactone decarboxylase family protein [Bacteroidota bacterium]
MNKSLLVMLFILLLSLMNTVIAQTDTKKFLNAKQIATVRISAITARGDLSRLQTELHAGLDAGLTVNQIKEAIVHLYAYAGFPRSIRGLQTFMSILDERSARGINDQAGPESTPVNDQLTKYERGKATLEQLTGIRESGPKTGYAAFSPIIEVFLKEHLFADIFERDILSFAERELVTISVLSSIGRSEPMLRSHFNICLNVGLSPAQLQQFVNVIKLSLGKKEAKSAQIVLDELLKSKEVDTKR